MWFANLNDHTKRAKGYQIKKNSFFVHVNCGNKFLGYLELSWKGKSVHRLVTVLFAMSIYHTLKLENSCRELELDSHVENCYRYVLFITFKLEINDVTNFEKKIK